MRATPSRSGGFLDKEAEDKKARKFKEAQDFKAEQFQLEGETGARRFRRRELL